MTWSRKEYRERLKNMLPAVDATKMKQYMDYRALSDYAKSKGVRISSLTMEEKMKFVHDRTNTNNN